MKNKNLYDVACEILKSNPRSGDFRANAKKILAELKKNKKNSCVK